MVNAAQEYLRQNNFGVIVQEERLHGGLTSLVLRLTFDSGRSAIYKESENAKPGMYACEAEGLQTLKGDGCPRTPEIFSVAEDHILIEDLGSQGDKPVGFWAEFGRQMAALHLRKGEKFGYHQNNYLGTMLLDNTPAENGHEFFARTRILRFVEEPKFVEAFTKDDIDAVYRLAEKLPELIPNQGPSLIHGDLWTGNMLVAEGGKPALIDPAVYYGWPEADLSLLPSMEEIPQEFYDAYLEVNPLEPGWRERLNLLAMRDPICMISEYGDIYNAVARVREVLDRYVR